MTDGSRPPEYVEVSFEREFPFVSFGSAPISRGIHGRMALVMLVAATGICLTADEVGITALVGICSLFGGYSLHAWGVHDALYDTPEVDDG